MDQAETLVLRTELLDRRQSLAVLPSHDEIRRLLQQVDAALDRMNAGVYGLCDVCHDPIEADRLRADPLLCLCLDHLSQDQRRDLEQDLELAVRIQTNLLPQRDLSFGEWNAYYHYEPAGAVSGDYCDLIAADGRLIFTLGDVAGKGVASSLLMSHLHAIFRSLLSVGVPVPDLIERANRVFCESTMPSHYATLICGQAGASGEIELANAGHCRPLLARRDGVASFDALGVPLGLFCSAQYPILRLHLEPDDLLVLYTDGVTETHNPLGEEYGEERLRRRAAGVRGLSGGEAARLLLEDLRAFRAGARRADDLTLLVIQRTAKAF